MELIAGDAGLVTLSEFAYLTDKAADLIVFLNCLAQGRIGNDNAEGLFERVKDMVFALESVESKAVVVTFHGYLKVLEEKLLLVLAHGLEKLHILNAAVHHGAAVRRDYTVGKVEATLNGALQQRS